VVFVECEGEIFQKLLIEGVEQKERNKFKMHETSKRIGTVICLGVSNAVHIGIQGCGFQNEGSTLFGIIDANNATWVQDLIAAIWKYLYHRTHSVQF